MPHRLLQALNRWVVRHDRIDPIGTGGYILRLKLTRHRGPRVVLRDGTVIRRGDPVGELHLDNERAAALHAQGHGGIRFRREVYRALAALAAELARREEYRPIAAVYGASLFWAEAAHAGFEYRDIPPFTRWWLGWWERYLLSQYHPEGRRRLEHGRRTELREVWMSRAAVLAFGRPGAETAAGGSSRPGRDR